MDREEVIEAAVGELLDRYTEVKSNKNDIDSYKRFEDQGSVFWVVCFEYGSEAYINYLKPTIWTFEQEFLLVEVPETHREDEWPEKLATAVRGALDKRSMRPIKAEVRFFKNKESPSLPKRMFKRFLG